MSRLVSLQPNGKYCLFSTIVDCPMVWNISKEEYITFREAEIKKDIENELLQLYPIEEIIKRIDFSNMTKEEFEKFLKDISEN